MWLDRILGNVTWAATAAHGSRTSKTKERRFTRNLHLKQKSSRLRRIDPAHSPERERYQSPPAPRHSPPSSLPPATSPSNVLDPWLAGGLFVDTPVRGRDRPVPRSVPVRAQGDLSRLTVPAGGPQNAASAGLQAPRAAAASGSAPQALATAHPGLKEMKDLDE
jgi:hypothetical protein